MKPLYLLVPTEGVEASEPASRNGAMMRFNRINIHHFACSVEASKSLDSQIYAPRRNKSVSNCLQNSVESARIGTRELTPSMRMPNDRLGLSHRFRGSSLHKPPGESGS